MAADDARMPLAQRTVSKTRRILSSSIEGVRLNAAFRATFPSRFRVSALRPHVSHSRPCDRLSDLCRRANQSGCLLWFLHGIISRDVLPEDEIARAQKLIPQIDSDASGGSVIRAPKLSSDLRKAMLSVQHPVSIRGAYAHRHETRGGMRWTRMRMQDGRRVGGRRSRVVLMPLGWRQVCKLATSTLRGPTRRDLQATVTKRSWTPGRSRSSVNTIAQGMPMFGFICGDYACVLSNFAHKAAGAVKHPAFPAPSDSSRVVIARLGWHCAARTRRRASSSLQ